MKIALAIDGSACALRALKTAIGLAKNSRKPPSLTLVVVDWSVPVVLASRMGEKNAGAYHEKNLREYGRKARTAKMLTHSRVPILIVRQTEQDAP